MGWMLRIMSNNDHSSEEIPCEKWEQIEPIARHSTNSIYIPKAHGRSINFLILLKNGSFVTISFYFSFNAVFIFSIRFKMHV